MSNELKMNITSMARWKVLEVPALPVIVRSLQRQDVPFGATSTQCARTIFLFRVFVNHNLASYAVGYAALCLQTYMHATKRSSSRSNLRMLALRQAESDIQNDFQAKDLLLLPAAPDCKTSAGAL